MVTTATEVTSTISKKIMRVLLDSGSDDNLVFVNKDKPMLLPSSKRLVPQSWNTLNGLVQTKHKAGIELNFFEHSDSKRFFVEPYVVEYSENNKLQYDLFLGTETMKQLGIILDFKAKIITVDEVILQMQNINHLQGASTLWALKLGKGFFPLEIHLSIKLDIQWGKTTYLQ